MAFGIHSLGPLLGPAIAPPIGGLLATYASWRWTFVLLGSCGVLVVICIFFFLPETLDLSPEAKKKRLRPNPFRSIGYLRYSIVAICFIQACLMMMAIFRYALGRRSGTFWGAFRGHKIDFSFFVSFVVQLHLQLWKRADRVLRLQFSTNRINVLTAHNRQRSRQHHRRLASRLGHQTVARQVRESDSGAETFGDRARVLGVPVWDYFDELGCQISVANLGALYCGVVHWVFPGEREQAWTGQAGNRMADPFPRSLSSIHRCKHILSTSSQHNQLRSSLSSTSAATPSRP